MADLSGVRGGISELRWRCLPGVLEESLGRVSHGGARQMDYECLTVTGEVLDEDLDCFCCLGGRRGQRGDGG